MSDRGMKKWAPYSSLIEQSTCLEEMKYQRNKIEKPFLTDDEKEKINRILSQHRGGELTIKYFYDGYLYITQQKIKRVDIDNQLLILQNGKLPLSAIIDIEDSEYFF